MSKVKGGVCTSSRVHVPLETLYESAQFRVQQRPIDKYVFATPILIKFGKTWPNFRQKIKKRIEAVVNEGIEPFFSFQNSALYLGGSYICLDLLYDLLYYCDPSAAIQYKSWKDRAASVVNDGSSAQTSSSSSSSPSSSPSASSSSSSSSTPSLAYADTADAENAVNVSSTTLTTPVLSEKRNETPNQTSVHTSQQPFLQPPSFDCLDPAVRYEAMMKYMEFTKEVEIKRIEARREREKEENDTKQSYIHYLKTKDEEDRKLKMNIAEENKKLEMEKTKALSASNERIMSRFES